MCESGIYLGMEHGHINRTRAPLQSASLATAQGRGSLARPMDGYSFVDGIFTIGWSAFFVFAGGVDTLVNNLNAGSILVPGQFKTGIESSIPLEH